MRFAGTPGVRGTSNVVRGASRVVRGASRVVGFLVLIGNLGIGNRGIGNREIGNREIGNRGIAVLYAQDVVVDRVLAVVNGDVITLSDARAARRLRLLPGVASMDDAQLVTQLIERRLVLAELARYAPAEPTPEQMAARRRAWAAGLPAGADVPKLLLSVGMREASLTSWLRDDLRIAAYLDQRFTAAAQPTREQALAYFALHEADFSVGGVTPQFSTVEAEVRRRVAADRRAARIRDWIESLKQRAEIRRLQ